jgi:nitrate/nitrite-specific signal transduction histidine kinase
LESNLLKGNDNWLTQNCRTYDQSKYFQRIINLSKEFNTICQQGIVYLIQVVQEMLVNITKHVLVPPHEVLIPEAKKVLLER